MKIKTKAIPFKIPKTNSAALFVQKDQGASFYSHLHYHSEIQITAIKKGQGVFYAGNNMIAFAEGDILIIGANVPHLLKSSEQYFTNNSPGISGVSIFFDEQAFGKHFFELDEMKALHKVIVQSKQVFKIENNLTSALFSKICDTISQENDTLLINFLQILQMLKLSKKVFLNATAPELLLNDEEGDRLNKVLTYTFANYQKEIKIETIARVAYLSRSQFSYFFKLHTGKTYINFLNELRLENASNLLKNVSLSIEQISLEVGFQNLSNFVRQFKKLKNVSPTVYRKQWELESVYSK